MSKRFALTNCRTNSKYCPRITSFHLHRRMFGRSSSWTSSKLRPYSAKMESNVPKSTWLAHGPQSTINPSKLNLRMASVSLQISSTLSSLNSQCCHKRMVQINLNLLRLVITVNSIHNVTKQWLVLYKLSLIKAKKCIAWHNTKLFASLLSRKRIMIWRKLFQLKLSQILSKLLLSPLRTKLQLSQLNKLKFRHNKTKTKKSPWTKLRVKRKRL